MQRKWSRTHLIVLAGKRKVKRVGLVVALVVILLLRRRRRVNRTAEEAELSTDLKRSLLESLAARIEFWKNTGARLVLGGFPTHRVAFPPKPVLVLRHPPANMVMM